MGTQFLDKTGLQYFWSLLKTKFSECLTKTEASSTYATKSSAVTKVKINGTEHSPTNGLVDLGTISGGSGGITQETDPTVPAWAKAANPPTYTAADVGALPDTTIIPAVPSTLSAFTDDLGSSPTHTHSQYLTEHQSLDGYLPKSGGTMTGGVVYSAVTPAKRNVDTSYIQLYGGTDWNKGAYLILAGKDCSDSTKPAGSFTIAAHAGTVAKALRGKPDGTLTWDGKRLLTEDDLAVIENGTY